MSDEWTEEDQKILDEVDAEIAAMDPEEVERLGNLARNKVLVSMAKKVRQLESDIKFLL